MRSTHSAPPLPSQQVTGPCAVPAVPHMHVLLAGTAKGVVSGRGGAGGERAEPVSRMCNGGSGASTSSQPPSSSPQRLPLLLPCHLNPHTNPAPAGGHERVHLRRGWANGEAGGVRVGGKEVVGTFAACIPEERSTQPRLHAPA